jgi:cation/acetate symporter
MKGITYTQVAQYCVLIFAYTIPAFFLAFYVTGNPIPQIALGGTDAEGVGLLAKLNGTLADLGFKSYTDYHKNTLDIVCITGALMLGTAGLPHVIIRFFTVKRVKDARSSAGWALLFIAILYSTAPAIAVFARTNMLATVPEATYVDAPDWVGTWEDTGLIAWHDRNDDGVIQYAPGKVFAGKKPVFQSDPETGEPLRGVHGQRLVDLEKTGGLVEGDNELYVDRDIMVLANPEIAGLPAWVIALVAAGGLAAALSTAAGLLMVISSAVSHDLVKRIIAPDISEKHELRVARIAAACAVVCAGLLGIWPPDYVAAVVAFAFGLAASSFFPAIFLGIFWKRFNMPGAVIGMLCGIGFTTWYILEFKFFGGVADDWWWGISPEGIGSIGMLVNFAVGIPIALLTKAPPAEVQAMVEDIRIPGSK